MAILFYVEFLSAKCCAMKYRSNTKNKKHYGLFLFIFKIQWEEEKNNYNTRQIDK